LREMVGGVHVFIRAGCHPMTLMVCDSVIAFPLASPFAA
jgi:hypothetical protein